MLLVEMRGVEPLSEIPANELSTSLAKDIDLSSATPLLLDSLRAAFFVLSLFQRPKIKRFPD